MGTALDSEDGVARGWCDFCGCRSHRYKRSSGIPMIYHVTRDGRVIDPRSRFTWWHNPERLIFNRMKAMLLRMTFRVMDMYKRITIPRHNQRHRPG